MTHPVTEILLRKFVENIVDSLFPSDKLEIDRDHEQGNLIWTEDYRVTEMEVKDAMAKCRGDKKAPDADEILGDIVSGTGGPLHGIGSDCFTQCLKEGVFLY